MSGRGETVTNQTIRIVQLYPAQMNIYGDIGNLEVLQRRAGLYGLKVETGAHGTGDDVSDLANADIVLGGGGQDSGQARIVDDLTSIGPTLRHMVDDGVAVLVVCGMYQLFGHSFITGTGQEMTGIGVFDMQTQAGEKRLIGNIVIETEFGQVVGYENHSGLTTLRPGQASFGTVIAGEGNCGDGTEGARVGNCFGTYLHGPVLPKNPVVADHLLAVAARRIGMSLVPRDASAAEQLKLLDDLAVSARQVAVKRPR